MSRRAVLDIDEIILINKEQAEAASKPHGVQDLGLLEGIASAAEAAEDPYQTAALYMKLICITKPFFNTDEATALEAAQISLENYGLRIHLETSQAVNLVKKPKAEISQPQKSQKPCRNTPKAWNPT